MYYYFWLLKCKWLNLNDHHWSENKILTLEILDNKIIKKTWEYVKNDCFEYKIITDFENKLDLQDIYETFTFTGIGPKYINIKEGNITIEEVYKLIYKTEIPKNVKLVNRSLCGCNMGHCGHIMGYSEEIIDSQTYGGLYAGWGCPIDNSVVNYFEYPDSVLLNIELIEGELKQPEQDCWRKPMKSKPNIQLDKNNIYICYDYSR